MPVMDEFKEEREALKHGTPKQKLSYFIDYYKWHTLVAIAAVIFVGSIIYQMATRKDTVFFAAMVNGFELAGAEEYVQSFAEYAGIDTESYAILLDTSLSVDFDNPDQTTVAASQKLAAYIAAKGIDVFVTDEIIMEQYAYNETFYDLRAFLTEEQFAQYEPYFYYMDQAVYLAKEAAFNAGDFDYAAEYPDPRNPEEMSDPVPVGIYLDAASSLTEHYYYSGDVIVGVVGNTTRPETASKYIDFIMGH